MFNFLTHKGNVKMTSQTSRKQAKINAGKDAGEKDPL
jgi:hypothetical protein